LLLAKVIERAVQSFPVALKGFEVMREIITLQCGDCKNRNYTTTKNKKKHSERMETKKFCNTCRKQTAHKEVK
jgi:large subunit ribosomal protein L33